MELNPLLIPVVLLLLPIVLTLCFGWAALVSQEAEQKRVWAAYRSFSHLILISALVGWWVTWDLDGRAVMISKVFSGGLDSASVEPLLFWVLPTVSLGVFLLLCRLIDQSILRLKWTITDAIRQAWWRLVTSVVPFLMVAAGLDAFLDKRLGGIAWGFAAGVVSRVGTVFLRRAEGMKFNKLKSGELRNRAFSIARGMGVTLSRVYIVPAGKGRLTNAYGMSNAIGLTDNLGKYLTKAETEYVIAHEVAHVKLKHGRKDLLLVIAIFSSMAVLLLSLPHQAVSFHPLIRIMVMFGPLLVFYYFSRRFEYSADKEAIAFTGDPETAIKALIRFHETTELPAASGWLARIFMTHPALAQRVRAIASNGRLTADGLTKSKPG